jgi:thiamine biosynthesis lipoprotein
VQLRVPKGRDGLPILDVKDAAIASSSGHLGRRRHNGQYFGPHVDGTTRQPIPTNRFVTVAASRCILADALTKIVLAAQEKSEGILGRYNASAHLYDSRRGWLHLGAA